MKHHGHIISNSASIIIDTLKYRMKLFNDEHPNPYDVNGDVYVKTVSFFINEKDANVVLPELNERLNLTPVTIETDNLIAVHISLTPGYEFGVFNTDRPNISNLRIMGL